MKKLLLILMLFVSITSVSQEIKLIGTTISRFERDGVIWISYDSKSASTQVFKPLSDIYQCKGSFLKMITDTVYINGIYRIYFGKEWMEISAKEKFVDYNWRGDNHIMFNVMCACFDKDFVYCQCAEKFKIINRNF